MDHDHPMLSTTAIVFQQGQAFQHSYPFRLPLLHAPLSLLRFFTSTTTPTDSDSDSDYWPTETAEHEVNKEEVAKNALQHVWICKKWTNEQILHLTIDEIKETYDRLGIAPTSRKIAKQKKMLLKYKRIIQKARPKLLERMKQLSQEEIDFYYRHSAKEIRHITLSYGLPLKKASLTKQVKRIVRKKRQQELTDQEQRILEGYPRLKLKEFCRKMGLRVDGSNIKKVRRLEEVRLLQRKIVESSSGDPPDALETFDALPWQDQLFFHSKEALNRMADKLQTNKPT